MPIVDFKRFLSPLRFVRKDKEAISGVCMTIWVDADACPGPIKELIIRTARRLEIQAVFVANKYISIPESAYISTVRVALGPEIVDEYIAHHAQPHDFAITQDIPLASALVPKGVTVINPRGELYTEENIRERLSIRNFMQDLREAGGVTPGPKQFGQREKQRFSDTLDRELTKSLKSRA
jgi:uncharacterized protein YaiI (UPF0178 family)